MAAMAMLMVTLTLLVNSIAFNSVPGNASHGLNGALSPPNSSYLIPRDAEHDPTNMHWIRKWAAIGDSFTAGIGAGRVYSNKKPDRKCSRYDLSYPSILDRVFGASITQFNFLACSGAKTEQIIKQIQELDEDLNLVVMTGGGNDLCLVDVLKACIFLPYFGEKNCDEAIWKAKTNIQYILQPNVKTLLKELQHHMVFNGVVLYGGYAQFFHDGEDYDEDCGKYQDWAFPRLGEVFEPLKLTLARRREFNELVRMANDGIQKAIKEQKQEGMRLRVRYVDWDDWASDTRVAGQFCWPKTTGEYPDSSQPMLQFFKPDTKRRYTHDDIKKREVTVDLDHSGPSRDDIEATVSKDLYNSALYKSGNPSAEALHMLDGRDIIGPANCPGADDDKYFGFGLPDRWGKFFHPNTNGHITLASFFLDAVVAARAEIIEVTNPICRDGETDSFECNAEKSDDVELKRYYAAADLVDESYQTYCEEVKPPPNGVNWHDERVFYEGTPEEHTYSISLEHGAFQFSKKQCFDSFLRLIHGCGTSLDANPMNLKHGGMWKKGRYTYKLSMGPKKRPWPIARPTGSCFGEKKIFAGAYTIKGAGWGTLDYGRAVHDESKSCIGRGLTFWDFKYYDESDSDGMEWEATFNTPIWVLWRCFQNNKVFHNIGGPSIGCEGDDHPNVPWH